jgi:hypothetical protein
LLIQTAENAPYFQEIAFEWAIEYRFTEMNGLRLADGAAKVGKLAAEGAQKVRRVKFSRNGLGL